MIYHGLVLWLRSGKAILHTVAQDPRELPSIPYYTPIRLHKIGEAWASESFIATIFGTKEAPVQYEAGQFYHTLQPSPL